MKKTGMGKKIFDARLEEDLKQEDVAKAIKVNLVNVNKWENGRATPSTKNLQKLAIKLKKPVSYFLEEGSNSGINSGIINISKSNKNSNITNTLIGPKQKYAPLSELGNIKDKLTQLFELKNEGLITEEEFSEKKKELLARI